MTTTVAQALSDGATLLAPVSGGAARREAGLLLGHVLGVELGGLTSDTDRRLTSGQAEEYDRLLTRRQRHQPVSQLIGKRAFWEHEFFVTPDVLDPRPDTELLVELALTRPQARRVLDLGTGSGCILCSVLHALPQATGVGVDLSDAALAVARKNAHLLRVAERAEFRRGSWFAGVEGRFDLILSNPPYVTRSEYEELDPGVRNWEPRTALTDEGDGLAAYREIARNLRDYLAPDGIALFEHGWQQAAQVVALFRDQGFADVRSYSDLGGKDRVVSVAVKTPSL